MMRKRFFAGLTIVIAAIWVPMWLWSRPGDMDPALHAALRFCLIRGIALGGYLLWEIVMNTLFDRHDD